MTSKSSRHLNSALFLCFEKKVFWVESWNIILNFSTFSFGGCWGQPMLPFWKLIHKTQISNPPEAASYRNSTKLLILLPLRDIYYYSLHYETPCMYLTIWVFLPYISDVLAWYCCFSCLLIQRQFSNFFISYLTFFLSLRKKISWETLIQSGCLESKA